MLKHNPEIKQKVLTGIKKAQSQLNAVAELIEKDTYCIDIIQQTKAVRGLLRNAEKRILENHLRTCFQDNLKGSQKNKMASLIDEIVKVTSNL